MASEPDLLADRRNDAEWVKYLLGMLRNWGYWDGEDDGQFGPPLDESVRRFQGDQGLVVDGWVGPKTWSVLVQEAVMINMENFPVVSSLLEIRDENDVKRFFANAIGVDDFDIFLATAEGDSGSV